MPIPTEYRDLDKKTITEANNSNENRLFLDLLISRNAFAPKSYVDTALNAPLDPRFTVHILSPAGGVGTNYNLPYANYWSRSGIMIIINATGVVQNIAVAAGSGNLVNGGAGPYALGAGLMILAVSDGGTNWYIK